MFALLKSNVIVRIVGERSLDNTYTVMVDVTEPYDEKTAIVISQDEVVEIDSNIQMLHYRATTRNRK